MAYIREYSPGGGWMGFPSIKSSYAYIWWLGLLRVVQALKVIILPLPLSAGVMCCLPLIFKPSLGRRKKLPQKVGRRELYRPVPPPSKQWMRKSWIFTVSSNTVNDSFDLFVSNFASLSINGLKENAEHFN